MSINRTNKTGNYIVGLSIILILSRLLPHPPNFTSVLAVILFCVSVLKSHKAFIFILLSYLVSDLIINNLIYENSSFYWISPGILWIIIPYVMVYGILYKIIKNPLSPIKLLASGSAASLLFFLISNFGVWINSQILYTPDLSGLFLCYYNAIPFFMNELAGTIFYTMTIFSLYWLFLKRSVSYEFN